jgi:hypothetical protein
MCFWRKFVKTITDYKIPNYAERLHQLLDGYIIQHFKHEKEEILFTVLNDGNTKEIKYVQGLQKEQEQIIGMIAEFKALISFYGNQPSREQVNKIIKESESLVRKILFSSGSCASN